MKIRIVQTFTLSSFLIAGLVFSACKTQPEPEPVVEEVTEPEVDWDEALVEQSIDATLWFKESGENYLLFLQNYELAFEKMKANLNRYKGNKPLAIIADLDETVLDNSAYFAERIGTKKPYSYDSWEKYITKNLERPLPGSREFFAKAEEMGIEIYYISNRPESGLEGTLETLQNLGYPSADPDHVRLSGGDGESDKTERRSQVMQTHHVVLFLGDNLSDFSRDFNHRESREAMAATIERFADSISNYFVIFPNPVYGDWEKQISPRWNNLNPEEKVKIKRKVGSLSKDEG